MDREIYLSLSVLTENDPRRNHDEYVFQIRGDIEQSGEEFFEEVAGVSAVPDEHMHEHRIPLRHLLRPFSNEIPVSKQLSPFSPYIGGEQAPRVSSLFTCTTCTTNSSNLPESPKARSDNCRCRCLKWSRLSRSTAPSSDNWFRCKLSTSLQRYLLYFYHKFFFVQLRRDYKIHSMFKSPKISYVSGRNNRSTFGRSACSIALEPMIFAGGSLLLFPRKYGSGSPIHMFIMLHGHDGGKSFFREIEICFSSSDRFKWWLIGFCDYIQGREGKNNKLRGSNDDNWWTIVDATIA